MKVNIIRKMLIILIIAAPLISYSGCKKQPKCGCGKDVLYTLTDARANVYWLDGGSIIYCAISGDPYSTYYFCNPSEMFPKMTDYKVGDELMVSGYVYYECSYLQQASNSPYSSLYKQYNIQVTDIHMDLFGK